MREGSRSGHAADGMGTRSSRRSSGRRRKREKDDTTKKEAQSILRKRKGRRTRRTKQRETVDKEKVKKYIVYKPGVHEQDREITLLARNQQNPEGSGLGKSEAKD